MSKGGGIVGAVVNPVGALVGGGGGGGAPVSNTASTTNTAQVNPTTNVTTNTTTTVDTTGLGNGIAQAGTAQAQALQSVVDTLTLGNTAVVGAVLQQGANDLAAVQTQSAAMQNQFSQTIDAIQNHMDANTKAQVIIALAGVAVLLLHKRS